VLCTEIAKAFPKRFLCTQLKPSRALRKANMTSQDIATRLLRIDEVQTRVALKKPTIYRAIRDGKFPAPCKLLGGRASAWSELEIATWIESRLASRSHD
jgi:prophage regulatory protein